MTNRRTGVSVQQTTDLNWHQFVGRQEAGGNIRQQISDIIKHQVAGRRLAACSRLQT